MAVEVYGTVIVIGTCTVWTVPGIVVVETRVDGIHVPEVKLEEQGMVVVTVTTVGGRVVRAVVDVVARLSPVTSTVLVNVGMVLHEDIVRDTRE